MNALATINNAFSVFLPRANGPSKQDCETLGRIRRLREDYRPLSGGEIGERFERLRAGDEAASTDRLAEVFALVDRAADAALGIEFYDVQLLAGMALARGAIAEMQTGEGKTFVAALPAALFALQGRGVHVMTVNAYLAQRDCGLLSPLYALLGITTGYLEPQASKQAKRSAYACDITYGTGHEFGFDYLRDQAALLSRRGAALGAEFRRRLRDEQAAESAPLQRGHAFAVIDEIDSVLIDEANSPLVLSRGQKQKHASPEAFFAAKETIDAFVSDQDYQVDISARRVRLTQEGAERAAGSLSGLKSLRMQRPWLTYVEQALQAQTLMQRDGHYVVEDGAIVLVDQATGRIFHDRSLRDGLHQAIEVKEGLTVTAEQQSLAQIARQRYAGLYEVACGMTGTASGSEQEFWSFYRLPVVTIPQRKEPQRVSLPTRFFASADAKWEAIVDEVERVSRTRQPVLVGVRTIADSRRLAKRLEDLGVSHQLLNGVQDAEESSIVSRAGEVGAVTIATNMAGRGTDIKAPEAALRLGGLHVIATEPHESERVDRQLIGRCGRQGAPGSCQLFVSADDPLLRDHARRLSEQLRSLAPGGGEVREDFSSRLAKAQRSAERAHYRQRRQLAAYGLWMDGVLASLSKEG